MLITDERRIADLLRCPACGGVLTRDAGSDALVCRAGECRLSGQPFAGVSGKSLLVDFDRSVLDRDRTLANAGRSILPRRTTMKRRVLEAIEGGNPITPHFAADMVARVAALGQEQGRRGRLLIVGGGAVGSGAEGLYRAGEIDTVAFDIYNSDAVTLIADAHAMPFADASFDGVWIQAVLEHVLDPVRVVAEIVRVLTPRGIVFADTPFLWPVHEAAYDYTRWTPGGHRWLFRDFDVLASGVSSGPGRFALLGMRYLAAGLFRSYRVAQLVTLPFVWLRLLDRFCDPRWSLDACAGVFFYGVRAAEPLTPDGLVAFFDEQPAFQRQVRGFERNSRKIG